MPWNIWWCCGKPPLILNFNFRCDQFTHQRLCLLVPIDQEDRWTHFWAGRFGKDFLYTCQKSKPKCSIGQPVVQSLQWPSFYLLLPVCMIIICPKNFIFWCVSGRKCTSRLYKTAGKMISLNWAQNQVSYIKRPRYVYPDSEHKTNSSVVHSREIPVTTFHLNYWNFFFSGTDNGSDRTWRQHQLHA